MKQVAAVNPEGSEEEGEEDSADDDDRIGNVTDRINHLDGGGYVSKKRVEPQVITVSVNGVAVAMEVDTGSAVSTVSESIRKRLLPDTKVEKTRRRFKAAGDTVVVPRGIIKNLTIEYEGTRATGDLYIIETDNPLIGRPWLEQFQLFPLAKSTIANVRPTGTMKERIESKYPALFTDGLGAYTGKRVELAVQPGTRRVFRKARPLPFALIDKVNAELDRLLEVGVIVPVETSEWATPIVPVLKTDGSVRICGDFKVTLNPSLIVKQYPLPRNEFILRKLAGGERFSKIDLANAYQQVLLATESRKYTTIATHRGLFQYTRLTYGIASAPAEFQQIMDDLTADLDEVDFFLNDAFATGKTEDQHF